MGNIRSWGKMHMIIESITIPIDRNVTLKGHRTDKHPKIDEKSKMGNVVGVVGTALISTMYKADYVHHCKVHGLTLRFTKKSDAEMHYLDRDSVGGGVEHNGEYQITGRNARDV